MQLIFGSNDRHSNFSLIINYLFLRF